MSNKTPANQLSAKCCVSDTAFLSPPTSIFHGTPSIGTPIWVRSPFLSNNTAQRNTKNIPLILESPPTSPTKAEINPKNKYSTPLAVLLALTVIFCLASFVDINFIRIATVLFAAFIFLLCFSREKL